MDPTIDYLIEEERKKSLKKKKSFFASKERELYTKILEYLRSNSQSFMEAFKTSYDIKIEKKEKVDEKYKKSQKTLEEFYFKLSEFSREAFPFKNEVSFKFLQWIKNLVGVYVKNEDVQISIYKDYIAKEFNIETNKHDVKGRFVIVLEQFIIFLEMFISLEDEEIISIIEIQDIKKFFEGVKKIDTIKLLRKNFRSQTINCSKDENTNEKTFDVKKENFSPKK